LDVGQVATALLATSAFENVVGRFGQAAGIPAEDVSGWLAYLAAMHDIGKAAANFQGKGNRANIEVLETLGLDCGVSYPAYRHEAAGAKWMRKRLRGVRGCDFMSAATIAGATRGHHGEFREPEPNPEGNLKQASEFDALRTELDEFIWGVFTPRGELPDFADHSTAGTILSGLIVLSDWIASNPSLFPLGDTGDDPEAYVLVSREKAQKAVAGLGFDASIDWTGLRQFSEVWPGFDSLRPIQAKCEQYGLGSLPPGLMVIEAPMGEGKTEAALYMATRWLSQTRSGGLYVALPTAATSNQMYGRVQAMLEKHAPGAAKSTRLVHGMAWLLDEESPEKAPALADASREEAETALDWFRPRKRSLLSSYAVGTIDQALMSVLNVRHGFLRLFGLTGKVLVIDEVHAYDAYMSEILSLLLKWCGTMRVPVILLSATLPRAKRESFVLDYAPQAVFSERSGRESAPYPLFTWVRASGGNVLEESVPPSARSLNVELRGEEGYLGEPEKVADLVAARITNGGCIAVIANTVDSAQRIFGALRERLKDEADPPRLILYHARFTPARRQEIEAEVLAAFDNRSLQPDKPDYCERPHKAILVATQVVEQSLDLDFDEMFSEIAPIDLILQRLGRLHRHERQHRPTGATAILHVLLPAAGAPLGPSGRVYYPYILQQTIETLQGRHTLRVPEEIRSLVEDVYGPGDASGPSREFKTMADREETLAKEAGQYLIPDPVTAEFSLAKARDFTFVNADGDSSSFFAARTRYGDDSRRYLVVEGDEFAEVLAQTKRPPNQTLKRVYKQIVNLPYWWLKDAAPAPGFDEPHPAPFWLLGVSVLRTRDGRWEGNSNGTRVTIVNDPILGFVHTKGE
jgi:CRISPR-associated endonuclease/helicase Cas3